MKLIGVICGMLFGILICVIFFKFNNKDGKIKAEYDERQNNVRGKSFKCGFYTMAVALMLQFILSMAEISLPMEEPVIYFSIFTIGGIALIAHSILNGAYWGLNTNKKNYMVLFSICFVINLLAAIMAFVRGNMIIEGNLSTPFVNFECALILLFVIVMLGVKSVADKKEESEE